MALINCRECGKEYSDQADKCPNCGCPTKPGQNFVQAEITTHKGVWSAGRLAIGIISILIFIFVTFQSCAVGIGNAIQENGDTSGSSGFALGIFVLIAGIVGICTRNSKGKAGAIITCVLYWFAAIFSLGEKGIYADLPIWGAISFIFGIVYLVSAIRTKKAK